VIGVNHFPCDQGESYFGTEGASIDTVSVEKVRIIFMVGELNTWGWGKDGQLGHGDRIR